MKYIFWDFDGTLAYRDGMWTGTVMSLLEKNGITTIRKEDIRPFLNIGFPWHSPDTPHEVLFCGKTWWEYIEMYFVEIFEKLGIGNTTAINLSKKFKTEYLDLSQWHLFEDTITTLEKSIKLGYKNIIISNHIPELEDLITALGLKKYFMKIYSSANIGYEKPNIKMYNHVLDDLGIDKNQCIMVGDSYSADVAGAMRAGLKAILVRSENTKEYKWYFKNIDEVPDFVYNLRDYL